MKSSHCLSFVCVCVFLTWLTTNNFTGINNNTLNVNDEGGAAGTGNTGKLILLGHPPLEKNQQSQLQLKQITTDAGLLSSTNNNQNYSPHEATQIFIGVCTTEESNSASTFLTKKDECPHISRRYGSGPVVSSFPNPKMNLVFQLPQRDTIYYKVLEKTKEINVILVGHDALYVPDNQFQDEMKLESVLMARRAGAGTYFIKSSTIPGGKIGRTTDLKSSKRKRYSDAPFAVVTVYYDALPGKVLSDVTGNLNSIYEIVKGSFNDYGGGLPQFFLGATFLQASQWEEQSGGMSIFYAITLHMTTQTFLEDRHFGGPGPFNRVMKAMHLNHIESSQQLNIGVELRELMKGEKHEHFYSNLLNDFVIANDRRVASDAQGPLTRIIEAVTTRQLSQLNFIQHPHSASWEPGFRDAYSFESVNRGFLHAAKLVLGADVNPTQFSGLDEEVRLEVVDHFAETIGCDLSSVADRGMVDIVDYSFRSCKNDDDDFFFLAKSLIYDTIVGAQNSIFRGKWKDPFQRPTDHARGSYDPRATYDANDRKRARSNNLESIRALKASVDQCVDRSNVHYTFMDTNNEAYVGKRDNLESFLLQERFIKIHTFSKVKVFAYQSPIELSDFSDCCIALVFLHSPLHLALESRPPWDRTSFGLEEWNTQSEAAVSGHYLHTISLTFRGVKSEFETPQGMSGTILPAFSLRAYLSWRLHVGDLRVGTLLAKALLLGKNRERVLDTSLMKVKALNKFCRRNGNVAPYHAQTFLDRLFLLISASSDDQENTVNKVYQRLKGRHHKDRDLSTLETKYLKENGTLMRALKAMFDNTSTQRQANKKQKKKTRIGDRLQMYKS